MNSNLHDQGESRDEKLRVTLVCNAGVLLEYRGTKVLLDSIYGPEGHPFSNLTDVTWQQMLQSCKDNIDYCPSSCRSGCHQRLKEIKLSYI